MPKRGKVLRDPHAGPGLLMVDGRQYQFSLEPVWKSEEPPKPGLPVDVEFGQSGEILAIKVVAESRVEEKQGKALNRQKRGWKFLDKIASKCGISKSERNSRRVL